MLTKMSRPRPPVFMAMAAFLCFFQKRNLSLFGSDLNEDNEIPEGKLNKKNRLEKENKNS